MKKIAVTLLAAALLLFPACTETEPDETSAATTTAAQTQAATTTTAETTDITGTLPQTKEIKVSREGQDEMLTAHLHTSRMGYYIYLFEDFELVQEDGGDIIRPKESSPLLKTINMRIARSGGTDALPKDKNENGMLTKYSRIEKGGSTYDIVKMYPIQAAEGGAVLLSNMLATLKAL